MRREGQSVEAGSRRARAFGPRTRTTDHGPRTRTTDHGPRTTDHGPRTTGAPPETLPAIREAIASGLPVVIVSRCPRGRVLSTYGYPGGGYELKEMGCLFAGSLPGQKARIRLMLALAASRAGQPLETYFEQL